MVDPTARYQAVLTQVLGDLQQELGPDLLGLLWAGSAAYGVPSAHSDLDVYVLIHPARRQRRTRWVSGVEVELFINPAHQIRAEFALLDHPATISMFAQGRILHDPHNVVAALVAEAQQIWRDGPPAVADDRLWLVHYPPTDLLTDARDLLDTDPEAAGLVMAVAVQTTLNAHYRLVRRWSVKPKYLLQDLATHYPELAQLARQVLQGEGPVIRRWEALAELIEKILEPIGGHPSEWESAWEPVSESPNRT